MSWRAFGRERTDRSTLRRRSATLAITAVVGGWWTAAGQATITDGMTMLARGDVAGAVRRFRLAAQDSSPALRSTGELWLGHLSWKVFADARAASAHLERAIVDAGDTSAVLVERARLLAFQRRYQDATRNAAAAMWSAVDAERRGIAVRA